MKTLVYLSLIALAGCAAIPDKPPFLTGRWGGEHVGLVLEGGLGQLQFDCAAGTIDEPIAAGRDGPFLVQGTYLPGRGGPVRVGEIFVSKKAKYHGSVEKNVMQLSVAVDDGTMVGPFTLTKDALPQITRCL